MRDRSGSSRAGVRRSVCSMDATVMVATSIGAYRRSATRSADWPALQGPHNAAECCALPLRDLCTLSALTTEAIEQGLRTYPGLPHRMERVAREGRRPVRQRQQGDQPDRDGAGAGGVPENPLDSRRAGQDRQSRRMRAAFRPCAQSLYHWRSGRNVRLPLVPAYGRGRVRDAGRGGEGGGGRGGAGGHGAAVAGLRFVRPVPGLSRRAAMRSAPRWGDYEPDDHRQDQGQRGAGRPEPLRPVGPLGDRPLVLGNRPDAAVAAGGADRRRADRGRGRLARPRRSAIRAGRCASPSFIISTARSPGSLLVDAGDDRHLDAAARPAPAAVAGRRAGLPRRAGAGAVARRRGERRQALAQPRRRPVPAVGVSEALLRRVDGLAAEPARDGQVAADLHFLGADHRAGRRSC